MKKIGVLGGSFNPVHNGHLRLALEAAELLGLDRVDMVPAARPPHKSARGLLGFEVRVRLIEAAVSGLACLGVNTLEAERPGPSYTCHTLQAYRALFPGDEIFFILGTGDLFTLPEWFNGLALPDLANLAVGSRPDVSGALSRLREFVGQHWPDAVPENTGIGWRFPSGHRLLSLEIPLLDISSSDVRERWRNGRSIRGLVPESVEQVLSGLGSEVLTAWSGLE